MAGLARWNRLFRRSSGLKGVGLGLTLLLCWLPQVDAHTGPPMSMLVDHMIGPYLASVWGDPEVGTGTFYIRLEPPPGGNISSDVVVHVGVQPLSNRLTEARHLAQRQWASRAVQYRVEVPFDAQELWRVRIIVQSSGGSGEATVEVETIPPGFGEWDVPLYLFPFVAVGFLGLQVFLSRRNRKANRVMEEQ